MSPSYVFADFGEDARSSPYVCPVEAELQRMNEELTADVESYKYRDIPRPEILEDYWGMPLHDPLPGSPAWFANELTRTASNQVLGTLTTSPVIENQYPVPERNEHQNNVSTDSSLFESIPDAAPNNGRLDDDDLDDFPPEFKAFREMVRAIVGEVKEVPAYRQAEREPGPFYAGTEAEEEADSPEQGTAQNTEEDTVHEEVEENAEEDVKEEDSDADETDAANSTSSSSVTIPPRKRKRNTPLKKQTKAPFKRARVNPRPTDPEWPEFIPQPLSAQAVANPAGFREAHNWIATGVRDVIGLRSITKTCGLIKYNARGGLGDWKAGVITHYLNAWIKHKHDQVIFRHGARDHAAQLQWYDSCSHAEHDEFRIWVMSQVEAALQVADRNRVQQLRLTQAPIVKPLDRAIAAGTWRHPTLGGAPNTNIQIAIVAVPVLDGSGQGVAGISASGTSARLGGHAGGNGTTTGALQPHHRMSGTRSSRKSRKHDREVRDDDCKDEESRGTGDGMDGASNGLQYFQSVQPQRRQNLTQQTIECKRDDADDKNFAPSTRRGKRTRRPAGNTSKNSAGSEQSGSAGTPPVRPFAREDQDNNESAQSARARGTPNRNPVQAQALGAGRIKHREVLPTSRPMSATEPSMTDDYQFFENSGPVQGFGELPSAGYSAGSYSAYPDPEELEEPHQPYY